MPRNPLIFIVIFILLLGQPAFIYADSTGDLQNEINQKQTQIQELEKQIAEYQSLVKSTQTQSNTLKNAIAKMEAQIKKLEAEVRLTQTKISQANLKIQGLDSDITTQNVALEKQKNNLSQTIQALNEYDQVGAIELILGTGNFSDILNQAQYVSNLQNGLQKKLESIKELKGQMEEQKAQSESQKAALENLRTQLHGQTQVLDSQRDDQKDLLATSKNQEKIYQASLTDVQKQRDQIEKEIYIAEEKLRLAINQNSITAGKGSLLWPAGNINVLTQNYGCLHTAFARRTYYNQLCDNKQGGYHNGIDIDGETGDSIRASRDGTVTGVSYLGYYDTKKIWHSVAYGKYVTVKHNNGLVTLYAHLSAQSVSIGQQVKAGDIIGYMGSTGNSTGSHLHFSVYATNTFSFDQRYYGPLPLGGDLNPLLYLP